MHRVTEHFYGENHKDKFDEISIPRFEDNENILKYCNIIINSNAEIKFEFPFQENPYHEIALIKQCSGCWNDSNNWENYVVRFRIIHHNGVNVIDEIDMVKSLFPEGEHKIFFQYRPNAEIDYYEPGIYWKLTDPQMDYSWLEDKLKMAAVSYV